MVIMQLFHPLGFVALELVKKKTTELIKEVNKDLHEDQKETLKPFLTRLEDLLKEGKPTLSTLLQGHSISVHRGFAHDPLRIG